MDLPLLQTVTSDKYCGTVKPCPQCHAAMNCQNTAQFSPAFSPSYYVMVCTQCNYGPLQAFTSLQEAIRHWNARSHDGSPFRDNFPIVHNERGEASQFF